MRSLLFTTFSLLAIGPCVIYAFDELPLRDSSTVEDKLLVLISGRVVTGKLTPRTGGYDVNLPAGRMFVPSEQIRFQANDMDDAYLRMRESLPELTGNSHLELARWCLANDLYSQARREVLDALHLDPYRADARQMLQALVRDEQRKARKKSATTQESLAELQLARSHGMTTARRSLGGLPAARAKEFTQRIQPLLSNKCGNAQCHGSGRNTFNVASVRRGATSAVSEQNLAAVLNQLNYAQPDQSPILSAVQGLHGGATQPLFPGQSGRRQVDTLRQWVIAVAAELSPINTARTSSSSVKPVRTEAPKRTDSAAVITDQTYAAAGAKDSTFVRDATVATRHDEFDPDVFNRRFHGRSRSDVGTTTEQRSVIRTR